MKYFHLHGEAQLGLQLAVRLGTLRRARSKALVSGVPGADHGNIIIIIITIIIIISIIIIMTMCHLSMAVAAVASWCSTSDLIFSLLARVSAFN